MKTIAVIAFVFCFMTVAAMSAKAKDESQKPVELPVAAMSSDEKKVEMNTAEKEAKDAEAKSDYDNAMKHYRKALRFTEPGSDDEARISDKIGKLSFDKNSASSPSHIALRVILSIVGGILLGTVAFNAGL